MVQKNVLHILSSCGEKNDASVKKIITSNKELIGVTVDPDQETADVNSDNNSWPKKESTSDFERFKEKIKG
jgi:hypothetical protein